jgi:hypothetical protein
MLSEEMWLDSAKAFPLKRKTLWITKKGNLKYSKVGVMRMFFKMDNTIMTKICSKTKQSLKSKLNVSR